MIRIAQQMGYQVEDDALLDEVRVLIQQGKKIKAIKLVRSRKGDGLKEAKEYVDEIENSMKWFIDVRTEGGYDQAYDV